MKYVYYPGCSLEGTAREYDLATRAMLQAVGVELIEIENWTCCGASAAEPISRLLSLALPARNIALAEAHTDIDDILVPCSACYLNLKKVTETVKKEPATLSTLNGVLAEEGLELKRPMNVRHLLDVLANDLGARPIGDRLQTPMSGFSIAPYYGCQCLRPYADFDDPEAPTSMEALIEATGATVFDWEMGGRCCGASHMNTKMDVALELVGAILEAAHGADAIVTVCPMCQMNLEAYQKKISGMHRKNLQVTILYLPQLLGLAMGLQDRSLGLGLNLAVTGGFNSKWHRAVEAA
ncbi:MAG: CoB--CoM heterodisulfide reductase iron-sulfur subunit B family protein [Deltaproteobacteria bacterium]|nr:CoB--CoM heterodisulfide reductase iron-sulfur subunit B family protein [Deltaproteobacteria bacterium]